MANRKKVSRSKPQNLQTLSNEKQPAKSFSLIGGGIMLALISLGLLIFVLSEKVLHLG